MKEYLTPLAIVIAAVIIGAALNGQKDIGRYQSISIPTKQYPNGIAIVVTDTKTGDFKLHGAQ